MVDTARTFGALMVGGIVAAVFSGIVTAQSFTYFKHYSKDFLGIRMLVGAVWFLDFCHTVFVSTSLWDHLIAHYGDSARIDYIPWSLALTIAFTAILTFLVHLFFVYRIYKLSKGKIIIAIPLTLLACARLCFACLTTAKMISLRSLKLFVKLYTFSFTSGLALSALLDILITGSLSYLLMKNRKQDSSLTHVLDTLLLYTFESGALTCAAAVTSLVCWLTNHKNLIFMGIHFVISKLYANSLLATLNAREGLHPTGHRSQHSNSADRNLPIVFGPDGLNQAKHARSFSSASTERPPVHIKVNQTTVSVADAPPHPLREMSMDDKSSDV